MRKRGEPNNPISISPSARTLSGTAELQGPSVDAIDQPRRARTAPNPFRSPRCPLSPGNRPLNFRFITICPGRTRTRYRGTRGRWCSCARDLSTDDGDVTRFFLPTFLDFRFVAALPTL